MDLFNVQEYLAHKHDSQHFVKCSDLEMNMFLTGDVVSTRHIIWQIRFAPHNKSTLRLNVDHLA